MLFDLSSLPKMILIVTLIVMTGVLFGAISYLLKTSKIDLPIINPVVEAQCEIDSECRLVYIDGDCTACSTSDEGYQCLPQEKAMRIEREQQKILSDPEGPQCSLCMPLFEVQHICKCANGKCEKVKKELVEEVIITTDKTEYELGEIVEMKIKNDLDKELTFVLSIENFENGSWNKIVEDTRCDCGFHNCIKLELYVEANSERTYFWNQKSGLCNELPLWQKLRIEMIYGERRGNSETIYSNEFTIKEKSALDARCGEKVVGVGLCEALGIGYEFNSETGKCIKRGVSGCSFEIPFQSLEECQEVCEEVKPKNKESCEAAGGKWEINDAAVCNLPTSDSGKECTDSSQCEGLCIAELSSEEYNKAIKGTVIYTKGRCSGETSVLGCTPIVNDGKVFGILCMD